jgi:hypothetical protein
MTTGLGWAVDGGRRPSVMLGVVCVKLVIEGVRRSGYFFGAATTHPRGAITDSTRPRTVSGPLPPGKVDLPPRKKTVVLTGISGVQGNS